MSEGKALIKIDDQPLVKHDASAFEAATQGGDYLPRLQLMTANTDKCKSGEFPINTWALVRDQKFTDLGKNVDVIIVTWRPKALEIGDELISRYDPNHDEFKRIQAKSFEQDSGCMFGPEYLVWIPSISQFATFFMGSKSARREAPNVQALLTMGATLTSKEAKNAKYTWYTPSVTACSTSLDPPDQDELNRQVEKFNNPAETEVERVDTANTRDR